MTMPQQGPNIFDGVMVKRYKIAEKITGPFAHAMLEQLPLNISVGRPTCLLDLACGTAVVTQLARQMLSEPQLAQLHVTLCDFSVDMLQACNQTITSEGWQNCTTVQGDMMDLTGLASDQYDYVTCNFGPALCVHPDRALSESLRMLKSGGRAGFTSWIMTGWYSDMVSSFNKIRSQAQLNVEAGRKSDEDYKLTTLPLMPSMSAVVNGVTVGGEWYDPIFLKNAMTSVSFQNIDIAGLEKTLNLTLEETMLVVGATLSIIKSLVWTEQDRTRFANIDLQQHVEDCLREKYHGYVQISTQWKALVCTSERL